MECFLEQLLVGSYFRAKLYIIYCFSVMGSNWQLLPPTPEASKAEENALRLVAAGPGNWDNKADLFILTRWYC